MRRGSPRNSRPWRPTAPSWTPSPAVKATRKWPPLPPCGSNSCPSRTGSSPWRKASSGMRPCASPASRGGRCWTAPTRRWTRWWPWPRRT
ncbi:hypothetical protein AZA_90450 [Nitrospirillum viridazoti Y2]|nr:hypothetical protein AZA_90450 [Nitrospirillum amazonense Y2]